MLKLTTREGNEIFSFQSTAEIEAYVDPQAYQKVGDKYSGEKLETWEEVQKKMRDAWDTGIKTMGAFVERLRKVELPEIKDHKIKTTYNSTDGEIDFDRMMAGQPNFYKKTERKDKSGPTEITIVIDTTTPSYVDPKDILWRGAAAIALTQILEDKGYKVEVWVVNGSCLYANHPERKVMTACCLKKPSDPLDSSTLVNTVSGWFYRTAIFTLLYTICSKENQEVAHGLGRCYTAVPADLDLLTVDELRVYSAGVFSFEGALSIITGEMVKLASRPVVE